MKDIISNQVTIFMILLLFYSCGNNKNKHDISYENDVLVINNEINNRKLEFEEEPEKILSLKIEGNINPNSQFYDFDTDNNLYILDQINSVISKYDSERGLLLTFGGKGQGPGEFRLGTSLLINSDTVLVSCLHEKKIIKYNLDGNYLSTKYFQERKTTPDHLYITEEGYLNRTAFVEYDKDNRFYFNRLNILNRFYEQDIVMLENFYDMSRHKDPNDYMMFHLAVSDTLIYVGLNSYKSVNIDVFDTKGRIKYKIGRKYRSVRYPLIESQKKNRNKYMPSILKIEVDNFERLWVVTTENNKFGNIFKPEFVIDIYENGINMGKLESNIIPDVSSFFIKRGKLIVASEEYIEVYVIPKNFVNE